MSCRFNKIVCVTQHIVSCLRMLANALQSSLSFKFQYEARKCRRYHWNRENCRIEFDFLHSKILYCFISLQFIYNIYYRNVRIGFILCIENRDISSRHLRRAEYGKYRSKRRVKWVRTEAIEEAKWWTGCQTTPSAKCIAIIWMRSTNGQKCVWEKERKQTQNEQINTIRKIALIRF